MRLSMQVFIFLLQRKRIDQLNFGLSIAKALMEKMGGTITADYRENVLEICVNVQKL